MEFPEVLKNKVSSRAVAALLEAKPIRYGLHTVVKFLPLLPGRTVISVSISISHS